MALTHPRNPDLLPLDDREADSMITIMRYAPGHKEEVRERIVQAAAHALRMHGIAGVSIPDLMKQVGLTHGGFYAHFENRDALVADAVRAAAQCTAEEVFSDQLNLGETISRYLSRGHLEHPEQGCVLAALGTDGPRQPKPVRSAFAEVARGFLRLIERKLHSGGKARHPSDEALAVAATMVGAVVLSRLVEDQKLSDRILTAARKAANN